MLGTIGEEGKYRVVTLGKCDMMVTGIGVDITDLVPVMLGVELDVETIGRCLNLPNGEIMFPSQSLAVAILVGKRTAQAAS